MIVLMVGRRRQWRAENQSIEIDREIGDNEFIIKGSEGNEYYVNINVPHCDCPDWEKREPNGGCKHIIKAKLKKGVIDTLPDVKTNSGRYTNETEYSEDWQKLSNQTKKRDSWTCQKCGINGGKYGDADLHAHHIVPKSKGGADKSSNLITLCRKCHENQHGHSIRSNEAQSDNTSTRHTPSKNKTKQPSASESNVNSERRSIDAANRGDDDKNQYYDVEPGLHPDSGQSWAIKDLFPGGKNIEIPPQELERGTLKNSKYEKSSKSHGDNIESTDNSQAKVDTYAGESQNKNEASALNSVEDSHCVQSSTDTSKSTDTSSASNSTSSSLHQEDNSTPTAFSQFLRGIPVTIFVISFVVGIAGTFWGIYQLLIQYGGNNSQMWLYLAGLYGFTNIWFRTWDYFTDFLGKNIHSVTMATVNTLFLFLILTVFTLIPSLVLGYVTGNLLWRFMGGICGLVYCTIYFGRQ